jgi:hypothetical protein
LHLEGKSKNADYGKEFSEKRLWIIPTKRWDETLSYVDGYGLKAIIEKAYPAVCQP